MATIDYLRLYQQQQQRDGKPTRSRSSSSSRRRGPSQLEEKVAEQQAPAPFAGRVEISILGLSVKFCDYLTCSDHAAVYDLSKEKVLIGRGRAAQIWLSDDNVSRRHALIGYKDGLLYCHDLGSTNGTYVNKHKVNDFEFVTFTDIIRIGEGKIKISPCR